MKVLSVNVGMPRIVEYRGEPLATGIFKEPVSGKIAVREFNLDGDGQADLRVHGGYYKAVYVYPSEHYEFWRRELPGLELPWGVFGENLTTEGILENDVRAGDRVRIGSAEFLVTLPRYPCFKLGIRFEHLTLSNGGFSGANVKPPATAGGTDIIRRFTKSGRSGFYLAIERRANFRQAIILNSLLAKTAARPLPRSIIKDFPKKTNNRELTRSISIMAWCGTVSNGNVGQ